MFELKNWITSSTTIDISVNFSYIPNNFLLPATWKEEKHYILKAEQGSLDWVYTEVVQIAKFVHYHHNRKNKERAKLFLIFIAMLSFKQVEFNYGKKEPWNELIIRLLSFLIAWILDTVDMVLLFFQFELKTVLHEALMKNLWGEQLLTVCYQVTCEF